MRSGPRGQVLGGVGAHPGAGRGVAPRAVGQHRAEVAERLRRTGRRPRLHRQEVGHRRVGVERLAAAGDDGAGIGPPERGLVGAQPHLERLRATVDMPVAIACHRSSLRTRSAAQRDRRADRDRQHGDVEVDAARERRSGAGRDGRTGAVRGRRSGRRRPAAQRTVVRVWSPGVSAWTVTSMRSTVEPSHEGRKRLDVVEEAELHAAPAQRLVQRGDHDVAHPGAHAPGQRSLVAEEHPPHQLPRRARPGTSVGWGRRPRSRRRGRGSRASSGRRGRPAWPRGGPARPVPTRRRGGAAGRRR